MTPQTAFDEMARTGIVAGMRGAFQPEVALKLVETLLEEGITTFEFTMNSVQPLEAMQAVKQRFGDKIVAGMGTVLDVTTAKRVIDAGADFIVSPAFQSDVVKTVLAQDVLMVPGVITPTECVMAWEMGVKMLKLFPVGALGLEYFKAIYGPLNHMKFMCNGAMTEKNASEFIQHGAVCAGMGGWLTGDGTWTESRLRSRAHLLVNAIECARGGESLHTV